MGSEGSDGEAAAGEDEEEEDPGVLAATEDEIKKSRSYMKDRVKDKTQAMLDEMRESVEDTVRECDGSRHKGFPRLWSVFCSLHFPPVSMATF